MENNLNFWLEVQKYKVLKNYHIPESLHGLIKCKRYEFCLVFGICVIASHLLFSSTGSLP